MITTAWFLSSWQQRLWAKQVTRKWAFSLLICLQTTNLPEYMSNVTVLKWKKSTFGWRASLLKIPILLDLIMKIKTSTESIPQTPQMHAISSYGFNDKFWRRRERHEFKASTRPILLCAILVFTYNTAGIAKYKICTVNCGVWTKKKKTNGNVQGRLRIKELGIMAK